MCSLFHWGQRKTKTQSPFARFAPLAKRARVLILSALSAMPARYVVSENGQKIRNVLLSWPEFVSLFSSLGFNMVQVVFMKALIDLFNQLRCGP